VEEAPMPEKPARFIQPFRYLRLAPNDISMSFVTEIKLTANCELPFGNFLQLPSKLWTIANARFGL